MYVPTIISKETMAAGVPSIIQSVTGTPKLCDLLQVYRHLMYYTQSKFTVYHPAQLAVSSCAPKHVGHALHGTSS